jgi:hypothetical protein
MGGLRQLTYELRLWLDLTEGKAFPIGTERTWAKGTFTKTANGWVPVAKSKATKVKKASAKSKNIQPKSTKSAPKKVAASKPKAKTDKPAKVVEPTPKSQRTKVKTERAKIKAAGIVAKAKAKADPEAGETPTGDIKVDAEPMTQGHLDEQRARFKSIASPAEQAAAGRYGGTSYMAINAQLRSPETAKYDVLLSKQQATDVIHNLDSVMEKSKIDKPIVTFRSCRKFAEIENLQPGDTFTDKGFMSTSASYGATSAFGDDDKSKVAAFHITSPAGTKMIPIQADGMKDEREMLLGRNSTVRIDRVEHRDDGKTTYYGTVVAQDGKTPKPDVARPPAKIKAAPKSPKPALATSPVKATPAEKPSVLSDEDLDKYRKKFAESGTPEEFMGVQAYRGMFSSHINGFLRNGNAKGEQTLVNESIKQLDSILAKNRLDSSALTYRGVGSDVPGLANLKPGEMFVDKAYMSTSTNPDFAMGGDYMFHITSPKGTKMGAIVADQSGNPGAWGLEREMLLARGTALRLDKREEGVVSPEGDKQTILHFTVVGQQ